MNINSFLVVIIVIVFSSLISCSVENKLPEELSNKRWVDISDYKSNFYKRCGEIDRSVITKTNTIQVELMETTTFDISRVEATDKGYKIYTKNPYYEEQKNNNPKLKEENDWYYNFRWINEGKGIATWEYISADGKIDEGYTFITVDNDFLISLKLGTPPCEVCLSTKECDSIKKNERKNIFLDSISKLKIDDTWYKEYNVWLESYQDNYNYNYLIKISKDSVYIKERYLKDLLIPYQKKDTLFLYYKRSLFTEYEKNKLKPEVKIVRIKDQYFIESQLFDLKNSISNKPAKYGFLIDEIK